VIASSGFGYPLHRTAAPNDIEALTLYGGAPDVRESFHTGDWTTAVSF
jgi:hypothetical protein